MERKLVTIRNIRELVPIEGADLIELALIDGWQCVVKKGEFKVGDPCLYFEIDSFLPIKPEYEFLRKGCYKKVEGLGEGFRVKTIRLKGKLSQGLALPVDPEVMKLYQASDREDGGSLTLEEFLGVKKYEKPIPAQLRGQVKGNFPSFLRKTDQERVQNLGPRELSEIVGHDFELTLKLDGSSMTVYHNEGVVGVCSRNLELKLEDTGNSFVKTAMDSGAFSFLAEKMGNYALQGELMGPGIQGNREALSHLTYFVFDVWSIDEQRYLAPTERDEFLRGSQLFHVPKMGLVHWTPEVAIEEIQQQSLKMAEDASSITNPIAEGLVFKRYDGAFSFKAISNKYLLGGGDD